MSLEKEKDKKDELKQKIDNIDDELNKENAKIKRINSVRDSLVSLKKNMDRCTSLLSKSLDPEIAKTSLDYLMADNEEEFKKSCRGFDEKSEAFRRRVIELQNERDIAIQEYERNIRNEKKD